MHAPPSDRLDNLDRGNQRLMRTTSRRKNQEVTHPLSRGGTNGLVASASVKDDSSLGETSCSGCISVGPVDRPSSFENMKCTDRGCDDTLVVVPHGLVVISPDAPATRMKSKRLVRRFILAVGGNQICAAVSHGATNDTSRDTFGTSSTTSSSHGCQVSMTRNLCVYRCHTMVRARGPFSRTLYSRHASPRSATRHPHLVADRGWFSGDVVRAKRCLMPLFSKKSSSFEESPKFDSSFS